MPRTKKPETVAKRALEDIVSKTESVSNDQPTAKRLKLQQTSFILCMYFYLTITIGGFMILFFTRLIALAFAAAIGITFLVLGCALKEFNNWWPMFVLFFYLLVPIPTVISRRLSSSFDSASSACVELCIFLTTGIVISALGLPIILARASVIQWGACGLVLAGNIVVFLTILGYFYVFANEDMDYSMW